MTTDANLRVLVCDDHPLFRRAVVTTLEDSGLDVVAEAATGTEAVERVIDHAPDVTLMDLRMPEGTGIDATAAIRRARPWARILVLSVSDDLDELVGALRAGALGHLRKEEAMARLGDAVRTVHEGGVVLGPALARAVALELDRLDRTLRDRPVDAGRRSRWGPSNRHTALLDRFAQGDDLAAAAQALGLDPLMARTELRATLEGLHLLAEEELIVEAGESRTGGPGSGT